MPRDSLTALLLGTVAPSCSRGCTSSVCETLLLRYLRGWKVRLQGLELRAVVEWELWRADVRRGTAAQV